MANKGLKGNYPIPDLILSKLKDSIDKGYKGKNRRRIMGYVKSGHLTDREIAKLIYDQKNHNLGTEDDLKIISKLIKWAEKEIKGKGEHIERTKRSQMDIGRENTFNKTHTKWNDDTKPISSKSLSSVPKPSKTSIELFNDRGDMSEGLNEELNRIKELMKLIK